MAKPYFERLCDGSTSDICLIMWEIKPWAAMLAGSLMFSGWLSLLALNWLKFDEIRALLQKSEWCRDGVRSNFRDRMNWIYKATMVVATPEMFHKRGLADLAEISKIPEGLRIWMRLTCNVNTAALLLMFVWVMVFKFPEGRHD